MKRLALLTLILCTPSFALKEWFSISRSIRSLGMGGAFYGLSNDEHALFYNPAGLALYTHGSQGMLSLQGTITPNFSDAIKTIQDSGGKSVDQVVLELNKYQGQPLHTGATFMPFYLRKHFAIGLLAPDLKVDVGVLGRDFDTQVDIAGIGDAGLFLGYGNSFFDPNLFLGFTVKGMYRVGGSKTFTTLDIVQSQTANLELKDLGGGGAGLDFDLGATYQLPFQPFNSTIRTSLVFNNLLASTFNIARLSGGGAPPGLTRTMTLAGHWRLPGWKAFDHFDVLLDFAEFKLGGETDPTKGARTGSFFKHVNWGVEAPFLSEFFALRLGFRQGYFSAGFGITTRFLKLDLATYQEEMLSNPGQLGSRRYAARFAFGFGSSAPAVEPATAPLEPKKDMPKPPPEAELKPPVVEEPPVEVPVEPVVEPTPTPQPEAKLAPQPKEAPKARKPQSGRARPGAGEPDRFNVDSLVEEYP